jgi:type IV secretory pathway VirB10-like protein
VSHTVDGATPIAPFPVAARGFRRSGVLGAAIGAGGVFAVGGVALWLLWPKPVGFHADSGPGAGFNMGRPAPDIKHQVFVAGPPPKETPQVAAPPREVAQAPEVAAPPRVPFTVWHSHDAGQHVDRRLSAAAATGDTPPGATALGQQAELSPYAAAMRQTRFADERPELLRFPPLYTIAEGTTATCRLQMPISSKLPGPFQCRLTEAVRSMNNKMVLLPPFTSVFGSIEHGVENGQDRIYVTTARALTPDPDFLTIPINSPGADAMGQIGVPGEHNTHFWSRLGATAAFTVLDVLAGAAGSLGGSGNGNNVVNLGGATNRMQTLGQSEFQRRAAIPDTVELGTGRVITIVFNHYLDLSRIYAARIR